MNSSNELFIKKSALFEIAFSVTIPANWWSQNNSSVMHKVSELIDINPFILVALTRWVHAIESSIGRINLLT